jgi:hypothetical protein
VDPCSRARHAYPRRPRTWHATGSSLPTRVRGNNVCHRRADLGELTNSRASAPEPRRNARASLVWSARQLQRQTAGGRPAGRVIPARSPHHCLLVLDRPTKPNQTTSKGTRPPQPQPRARPPRAHAPPLHFVRGTKAPRHFPRNPQAWAATTTSVSLSLSVVLFLKKKNLLCHTDMMGAHRRIEACRGANAA